ncbi:hypothetical protein F2P81_025947 [Scophthalmus maximus]|uniref:Uncharacterized protein n=1 Tax=Scophthalmus maximus TaxID=52904 RepID=A0A6A4RNF5_SCOMX|nr:hypothetical protein F2P81_025947 [Scophthalmus maximus]
MRSIEKKRRDVPVTRLASAAVQQKKIILGTSSFAFPDRSHEFSFIFSSSANGPGSQRLWTGPRLLCLYFE